MKYVYSTLSNDQKYCEWDTSSDALNRITYSVTIKGGANVAQPQLLQMVGQPNNTPSVVRTDIKDEDAEFLMKNNQFIMHLKNGFVKIENSKLKDEKALKGMTPRDKSAPRTPASYAHSETDSSGAIVVTPHGNIR